MCVHMGRNCKGWRRGDDREEEGNGGQHVKDLIQLKLQVCKGGVCVLRGATGEKEQTSRLSWFQRGKETLGVAPQGGASELTVHLGAVR